MTKKIDIILDKKDFLKRLDIKNGVDGKPGIQGKDGEKGGDGKDGEQGSPDTPEEIVSKIETLEGEARLDAKAVKNLPEFIKSESKANFGFVIRDVTAGNNITIDKSDPNRPIISSSGSSLTVNETPAGLVNGTNKVFTTLTPFTTGKTMLYLNGMRQKLGAGKDYTETGASEITFISTPQTGDELIIDYA